MLAPVTAGNGVRRYVEADRHDYGDFVPRGDIPRPAPGFDLGNTAAGGQIPPPLPPEPPLKAKDVQSRPVKTAIAKAPGFGSSERATTHAQDNADLADLKGEIRSHAGLFEAISTVDGERQSKMFPTREAAKAPARGA